MAESSRVQNTPPWTEPIGLYRCSPTSRPNATRPRSTLRTLMPSSAAIGGPGMRPSAMPSRYSRPLRSRASAAPTSGSCQVTVRCLTSPASSQLSSVMELSLTPTHGTVRLRLFCNTLLCWSEPVMSHCDYHSEGDEVPHDCHRRQERRGVHGQPAQAVH